MSTSSLIVAADVLRSIAFGSITGSFGAIGTAFTHPMRLIKIINTCNTDMIISFDGTNANDYIPAGSFSLYDLTTNQINNLSGWFFRVGTQVYVEYASAPASGNVYVIALYGQGDT